MSEPAGVHRCANCGGLCTGQIDAARRWVRALFEVPAGLCGVFGCAQPARWEIVTEWDGRPLSATHCRRCDRHGAAFARRWGLAMPAQLARVPSGPEGESPREGASA